MYQVRGKLFALSEQNQWKERGTGMLRLNVRREDGGGARLSKSTLFSSYANRPVKVGLTCVAVMRKEAVYTVLLNATLFKGMRCFPAQDPRYIRFSVIEHNVTTHYNLRVRSHSAVLLSFLTLTGARFRCRMRRSPKSSSRRSTRTSPPSRSFPSPRRDICL